MLVLKGIFRGSLKNNLRKNKKKYIFIYQINFWGKNNSLKRFLGWAINQEWPQQTKPKKGQLMNFSKGHSGTKAQCESHLVSQSKTQWDMRMTTGSRFRSGSGKPNQRKVGQFMNFHRGILEQKFEMWIVLGFQRQKTSEFTEKWARNSFELFVLALSLVWFCRGDSWIKDVVLSSKSGTPLFRGPPPPFRCLRFSNLPWFVCAPPKDRGENEWCAPVPCVFLYKTPSQRTLPC